MFAEVAFPIRSFQTFTYSIPAKHILSINVGTRVSVPFRNKIIQGIVVKIKKNNSYSGIIKRIIEPVDKVQVITPPLWKLINWVSKYYMTPIGQVANSVVPKSLSSNYKPQLEKYVKAKKKVNLGLDLQGGSYLLLEVDKGPVINQTLQTKLSQVRNYFKKNEIKTFDYKLGKEKIFFKSDKTSFTSG